MLGFFDRNAGNIGTVLGVGALVAGTVVTGGVLGAVVAGVGVAGAGFSAYSAGREWSRGNYGGAAMSAIGIFAGARAFALARSAPRVLSAGRAMFRSGNPARRAGAPAAYSKGLAAVSRARAWKAYDRTLTLAGGSHLGWGYGRDRRWW